MTRSRTPLSILLVLSLLAAGTLRSLVQARHDHILPRPLAASRLSGLDSFALGLLLGGLRGPLVMVLWSSTENQKITKNLEDIDTKLELIRMLQPQFDSVLIYQMWNKGWNLSVMMANLQNKYTTILDALDYGRDADLERPDNVNILFQIGEIYFNKLGNPVGSPTDRRYHNTRIATETLPSNLKASTLQKAGPGLKRSRHDVLLDSNGFILPALLVPRLATTSQTDQAYTGAELQYLAPYNTLQAGGFPHGIHPLTLAYNYYKRAAVLQTLTNQRHLYMGEHVIDSRPAVALKYWAENIWEHARRLEAQLLTRQSAPDEKLDLEPLTAAAALDAPFIDQSDNTRKLLEETLFSYRRAVDVAIHAQAEYRHHVGESMYAEYSGNYLAEIDSCAALAQLLAADHDYLALIAAAAPFNPPITQKDQLDGLRRSAAQHYRKAIDLYYVMILRYYTPDDIAAVVYPKVLGLTIDAKNPFDKGKTIQTADPKLYPKLNAAVNEFLAAQKQPREHAEDVAEYETYIRRATTRLAQLAQ